MENMQNHQMFHVLFVMLSSSVSVINGRCFTFVMFFVVTTPFRLIISSVKNFDDLCFFTSLLDMIAYPQIRDFFSTNHYYPSILWIYSIP